MSTRAQIVVEGLEEIKLYRHSDGYPEGVLPVLEPFVQDFLQKKGWDPEYLLARMVAALVVAGDDLEGTLGYGLSPEWAPDIEYWYRVRRNGKIECWKTLQGWWEASYVRGFRPEEHSRRLRGKLQQIR